MLEKLLQNKGMQKLLQSQFKDIIESEGVKTIVVQIRDDGKVVPELYNKRMIAIDEETYKAIMNKLKNINNE